MATRLGKTIQLDSFPSILSYAAIVGKKEGEGPLSTQFDAIHNDTTLGEKTWEKAESRLQKDVLTKALEKAGLPSSNIDYVFAGDLLNQCIGSTFGLREFGSQFVGLYGACSTMAESLAMAALFVDTSVASHCAAVTASHFCSAERQFRFPLEYGSVRTPTAQWTVTGAGACIVGPSGSLPIVKAVTFGTIEDLGIKDANNMGAAMAPAAAATLIQFLNDTSTSPDDYDLILTGDLGQVGSDLLKDLLLREHIALPNHNDCGLMIFDPIKQKDVNAGGSGCGCSASVLCSYICNRLRDGSLKDVLFIATGALLSTTSTQQGQSIPSVAHLVHLSSSR